LYNHGTKKFDIYAKPIHAIFDTKRHEDWYYAAYRRNEIEIEIEIVIVMVESILCSIFCRGGGGGVNVNQ
jgi:hypothetical protein